MQTVEANGARIPAIGLGTMTLKGETCVEIVGAALRFGYRHLDTAQMYGNEAEVGQGLRDSGLARDEVFVTTKVWHSNLAPADFERTFEESLKKLDLASVDLLLIHWPNAAVPMADMIGSLCKVAADKRARHVGVANVTVGMVEEAVRLATVPLVTNQIEVHPYIDQRRLIDTCRKHGLSITAYCPLARGGVPSDPVLQRIGAAHGRSASQVALRWLVQQGLIAIPRTASRDRLAENLAVFDFDLSAQDMADIAALRKPNGRLVSPAHAPNWDT